MLAYPMLQRNSQLEGTTKLREAHKHYFLTPKQLGS